MSERTFLILLAGFGVIYLVLGVGIEAPFAYDPLGPRAFPVGLGICLLVLTVLLFWFTGPDHSPFGSEKQHRKLRPGPRVIRLASIVLLYLVSFSLLGFMTATTMTVYLIGRSLGSSWMEGLLTGLLISIIFYGIFHFLLGVPLPLGMVFRVVG